MARRAGAEIYFLGAVGDDLFGNSIAENFTAEGIDISLLHFSEIATGVAHIWVDGAGENRILIVPGANSSMNPDLVAQEISDIADLGIVIAQCEIPQEVTLAAFKAAKARGAITLLNPAPYQPLSPEILELTDWLIPNEIEFSQLHPLLSNRQESTAGEITSDELLGSLRPGRSGIVTLGAEGAALIHPSGKIERIATEHTTVIDSTGAGDGFIGAFAAALLRGLSPRQAVEFGCRIASLTVTRKGAQSSYPSVDEISKILEEIH